MVAFICEARECFSDTTWMRHPEKYSRMNEINYWGSSTAELKKWFLRGNFLFVWIKALCYWNLRCHCSRRDWRVRRGPSEVCHRPDPDQAGPRRSRHLLLRVPVQMQSGSRLLRRGDLPAGAGQRGHLLQVNSLTRAVVISSFRRERKIPCVLP